MLNLFEDLTDALAAEKEAYGGLLCLSEQKKEALVRNDTSEVDSLVRRETHLLRKARELGRRSMELQAMLSRELGLPDGADIGAVFRTEAAGGQAGALWAVAGELKRAARKLRRCNEQNRALVEAHMQYNAFCIGLLSQNAQAGGTYGHTGHMNAQAAVSRGLLDQKA